MLQRHERVERQVRHVVLHQPHFGERGLNAHSLLVRMLLPAPEHARYRRVNKTGLWFGLQGGGGGLHAADEQQALQNVKLEGNAWAAGRVVVLLLLFLLQPRLQNLMMSKMSEISVRACVCHRYNLQCCLRQWHNEPHTIVQNHSANAVEIQHDGARTRKDGGYAIKEI